MDYASQRTEGTDAGLAREPVAPFVKLPQTGQNAERTTVPTDRPLQEALENGACRQKRLPASWC